MARPKGAKNKKTSQDPMIEEVIEQEVEFICPVRGIIKQKVKIKRLKRQTSLQSNNAVIPTDDIENMDSDLESYDEIEDIED